MADSNISISGLTTDQKLNLMEAIWVDLSQQPEQVPSPDWHGDVLAKRRQSVLDGSVDFEDWDVVKERLLKRHS